MKTAGVELVKLLRTRLQIWIPVRAHDPINLLLALNHRKKLVLDQILKGREKAVKLELFVGGA